MTQLLHDDCMCCLARVDGRDQTPEDATMTVLVMLASGSTYEGMVATLCFYHRRWLFEYAAQMPEGA